MRPVGTWDVFSSTYYLKAGGVQCIHVQLPKMTVNLLFTQAQLRGAFKRFARIYSYSLHRFCSRETLPKIDMYKWNYLINIIEKQNSYLIKYTNKWMAFFFVTVITRTRQWGRKQPACSAPCYVKKVGYFVRFLIVFVSYDFVY